MRRRFGQSVRLGVCEGGMALLLSSRWHGEPLTLLAEQNLGSGADMVHFSQAVSALLAPLKGRRWPLTIVLADSLVRMWLVTPPKEASRLIDLEAAAALRFQSLYGEPVANWRVSADWDVAHPFLAAAIPCALLALLTQCAAAHQISVVGVVPQFVASWNRWRGGLMAGSWHGQLHGNMLTLGITNEHGLSAVRVLAVPDQASAEWLGTQLAREALLLDVPLPPRLQLSGPTPQAWQQNESGVVCSLLDAERMRDWSTAAQLAATGNQI